MLCRSWKGHNLRSASRLARSEVAVVVALVAMADPFLLSGRIHPYLWGVIADRRLTTESPSVIADLHHLPGGAAPLPVLLDQPLRVPEPAVIRCAIRVLRGRNDTGVYETLQLRFASPDTPGWIKTP